MYPSYLLFSASYQANSRKREFITIKLKNSDYTCSDSCEVSNGVFMMVFELKESYEILDGWTILAAKGVTL